MNGLVLDLEKITYYNFGKTWIQKISFFLHGALGSQNELKPLEKFFEQEGYNLRFLEFDGHGKKINCDSPFSIDQFCKNLNEIIPLCQTPPILFGHSLGGYVAMTYASRNPEKIHSIFTFGTRYFWDKETATRESVFLNPEKIMEKVPNFGTFLESTHGTSWKYLLPRTKDLLLYLADNDYLSEDTLKSISIPVTVLVGDRDHLAQVEISNKVAKLLPKGNLGVLPGTPHGLNKLNWKLLSDFFLTSATLKSSPQ